MGPAREREGRDARVVHRAHLRREEVVHVRQAPRAQQHLIRETPSVFQQPLRPWPAQNSLKMALTTPLIWSTLEVVVLVALRSWSCWSQVSVHDYLTHVRQTPRAQQHLGLRSRDWDDCLTSRVGVTVLYMSSCVGVTVLYAPGVTVL